jgi:hypothetical protein
MATAQTITIGRTTYDFVPETDSETRTWDGQTIQVGTLYNSRGWVFAEVLETGNGARFAATSSRGLLRVRDLDSLAL